MAQTQSAAAKATQQQLYSEKPEVQAQSTQKAAEAKTSQQVPQHVQKATDAKADAYSNKFVIKSVTAKKLGEEMAEQSSAPAFFNVPMLAMVGVAIASFFGVAL